MCPRSLRNSIEVRTMNVGARMRGVEGKVSWSKLVVSISLAAAILVILRYGFGPMLISGWHEHDRDECADNLRKIGMALHAYANEYNDEFPPGETVEEVFPELAKLTDSDGGALVSEEMFLCPGARGDRKEWKRAGTLMNECSSYAWTPGLYATAPASIMVAHDKSPEHHGGGRNALFVDGRVEWLTEEEFQKKMAEHEEKIREIRADPDAWRK